MLHYFIRRLLLLPLTLFCIILVNFVIINLAPGDPVTVNSISADGATRSDNREVAFGGDDRYLQFREHYGLTLPILFNDWPSISLSEIKKKLAIVEEYQTHPNAKEALSLKDYDALRLQLGDQARFIMPKLVAIMQDSQVKPAIKSLANRFFIRGGTRQAYLGPTLTAEQKAFNRKIGQDNNFLAKALILPTDHSADVQKKIQNVQMWYQKNREYYHFEPVGWQKTTIFLTENRLYRYLSRVINLDFGTLRNDNNKTVIEEVAKRLKYSLTLSLLPMLFTFFICQFFGLCMAYYHNRWPDHLLNVLFLILYAIPIFVVAPFLIEKIALQYPFPFTSVPIPLSGFTSADAIYDRETSLERLGDILKHICLPLIAILYGSLAAQARLSRTAILEVMHCDYIRTARAKGLSTAVIMIKHVGRNAAITIVTSLASSLGLILAGSLVVETLFDINGFGKFFYEAILNRDYNVIMFSALASSFLSLIGYLVADLAYTCLDPRLTLE